MKFTLALIAVVGIAEATWKSGSVATYDKFTYGKVVASMKTPNKKGTVSSVYTFWDGPGFYPGGWNEIDMNVVPSVTDTPISTNVVYGDGHNKMEDHEYRGNTVNHTIDNDWHTYALEWTPEYVSWSVDGDEVRRIGSDDHEAVKFLHKDSSLRMNFWTPTFHAWGADFNPSDMPWYVLFDYVEVYNYDKEKKKFEKAWRDDFGFFDQTRWHKISGTFDGNSSVFYPQNAYVQGGHLVLKMEPDNIHHMHRTKALHSHYNSDAHKQQSEIAHMERDPMVRDATRPSDLHSYLGRLQPTVGGTIKPKRDYGPDVHGLHLEPSHQAAPAKQHSTRTTTKKEDKSKPTSLNLKEMSDKRGAHASIHDVQDKEHKTVRELTHDKSVKAHIGSQMHLPSNQQHTETDPMRKHLDKARHIEAEFDTTVSTIGHLDGNMYLAQSAGKKQQQKSKHDQALAKGSQTARSHPKGADTKQPSGPTKPKPYDTHDQDDKGVWREEVLEMTPYEHHQRKIYEEDHLGAHFWQVGHGQPSLYHRLQDHYMRQHQDDSQGRWEGVSFEVPVHEEVHYTGDREHAYQAPIAQDHDVGHTEVLTHGVIAPAHHEQLHQVQEDHYSMPVEVRPPAPYPQGFVEHPIDGPLFGDLNVHEIQHEFMDLPRDLSDSPPLMHEFDTQADYEPIHHTRHDDYQPHDFYNHRYTESPYHEQYADGMSTQNPHSTEEHLPSQKRHLDIDDQYQMYKQDQDFIHYYQPEHAPAGVWTDPYSHKYEEERDDIKLSALQFEVLAQTKPKKPKSSPKPSQQKKAPAKAAQPEHKKQLHKPQPHPADDQHHPSAQTGTAPHKRQAQHPVQHPVHQTVHHVAPHHEPVFHTTVDHDSPHHAIAHHEAPRHAAPHHKASHHVSPDHEAAHEVPHHTGAHHEVPTPEKDHHQDQKHAHATTTYHHPAPTHTAPYHAAPYHAAPYHAAPHHGAPVHEYPQGEHYVVAQDQKEQRDRQEDQDVASHQAHHYVHHELPFKQAQHEEPLTEIVHHEKVHHESYQKPAPKHPDMPALHHEHLPKKKMDHHYEYEYPDEHSYRRLPTEDDPKDIHEREVHEKHSAWQPAYAYEEDEHEHKEKGEPMHLPEHEGGFKTAYGKEHGLYHQQQTPPFHEHPGHGDYEQEHDVHDVDHDHQEDYHVEDHQSGEEIAHTPHALHEMTERDVQIEPLFDDEYHERTIAYGEHAQMPVYHTQHGEEQSYELDTYGHVHQVPTGFHHQPYPHYAPGYAHAPEGYAHYPQGYMQAYEAAYPHNPEAYRYQQEAIPHTSSHFPRPAGAYPHHPGTHVPYGHDGAQHHPYAQHESVRFDRAPHRQEEEYEPEENFDMEPAMHEYLQ